MGTGTTGTPRTGGYIHHSRTGGVVFLNLLGKRSKPDLANRIKEPLDWNQAKIEPVDTTGTLVTEGEFKGLLEVSWRITIPVKPRPQETLATRVIAFFKTALNRPQAAILQRTIESSLAAK